MAPGSPAHRGTSLCTETRSAAPALDERPRVCLAVLDATSVRCLFLQRATSSTKMRTLAMIHEPRAQEFTWRNHYRTGEGIYCSPEKEKIAFSSHALHEPPRSAASAAAAMHMGERPVPRPPERRIVDQSLRMHEVRWYFSVALACNLLCPEALDAL